MASWPKQYVVDFVLRWLLGGGGGGYSALHRWQKSHISLPQSRVSKWNSSPLNGLHRSSFLRSRHGHDPMVSGACLQVSVRHMNDARGRVLAMSLMVSRGRLNKRTCWFGSVFTSLCVLVYSRRAGVFCLRCWEGLLRGSGLGRVRKLLVGWSDWPF